MPAGELLPPTSDVPRIVKIPSGALPPWRWTACPAAQPFPGRAGGREPHPDSPDFPPSPGKPGSPSMHPEERLLRMGAQACESRDHPGFSLVPRRNGKWHGEDPSGFPPGTPEVVEKYHRRGILQVRRRRLGLPRLPSKQAERRKRREAQQYNGTESSIPTGSVTRLSGPSGHSVQAASSRPPIYSYMQDNSYIRIRERTQSIQNGPRTGPVVRVTKLSVLRTCLKTPGRNWPHTCSQ